MAVKTSGPIGLSNIAPEYRFFVGPGANLRVNTFAALTAGLTSNEPAKFSDFYGKESAFSAPSYTNEPIVGVYFDSVDRVVDYLIDLKSMGNRWLNHWSDFNFNSFSYSNPNIRGLTEPGNYTSVTLNTTGSSGRGGIYISQQPTALNNWIGIAQLNDNDFSSRGAYNLRINVTTVGDAGPFTVPNLWFDKTAILANALGSPPPNSTTVTALFHPKVFPISFSWTAGSSAYTLTNATSQTVTVTNNTSYYDGSYQFGNYNIFGSTLTCAAVLRYNNINYNVSKQIFVHSLLTAPPFSGGGGDGA
jgi:hypothetical protein